MKPHRRRIKAAWINIHLAELHGNSLRARCADCERTFPSANTPSHCQCGGVSFRSSVINFGDNLPQRDLGQAQAHSARADVYLVIGSSLQVTPAADLPADALERGAKLVLVNLGDTPMDARATLRRALELSPGNRDIAAHLKAVIDASCSETNDPVVGIASVMIALLKTWNV